MTDATPGAAAAAAAAQPGTAASSAAREAHLALERPPEPQAPALHAGLFGSAPAGSSAFSAPPSRLFDGSMSVDEELAAYIARGPFQPSGPENPFQTNSTRPQIGEVTVTDRLELVRLRHMGYSILSVSGSGQKRKWILKPPSAEWRHDAPIPLADGRQWSG